MGHITLPKSAWIEDDLPNVNLNDLKSVFDNRYWSWPKEASWPIEVDQIGWVLLFGCGDRMVAIRREHSKGLP